MLMPKGFLTSYALTGMGRWPWRSFNKSTAWLLVNKEKKHPQSKLAKTPPKRPPKQPLNQPLKWPPKRILQPQPEAWLWSSKDLIITTPQGNLFVGNLSYFFGTITFLLVYINTILNANLLRKKINFVWQTDSIAQSFEELEVLGRGNRFCAFWEKKSHQVSRVL